MRYKFVFSSFALISFAVLGILFNQFGCKAAASVNDSTTAVVEPTPDKKPAARTVEFTDAEFDGKQIVKTEQEWKAELTAEEYRIMREDGTERAYSNKAMLNNKKAGTYHCAACGLALFKSTAKYDSQTGWPSFFQPIFKKNVAEKEDRTIGEVRTEVECARCGAHLGHVFDDGPEPTGLRYCINSPSLKFKEGK